MLVAVTPEISAGMWLPAGHFALGSTGLRPVMQVNLPQPVRTNKTIGLVTLKAHEADGR
jgi:hypothetical protein